MLEYIYIGKGSVGKMQVDKKVAVGISGAIGVLVVYNVIEAANLTGVAGTIFDLAPLALAAGVILFLVKA